MNYPLYDYPITIKHHGLGRDFVVCVNRSIYSKEQADKAKMLVEEILDVIYRVEGGKI